MSRKILSIDIQEDRLSSVVVSHGVKGVRFIDSFSMDIDLYQDEDGIFDQLKKGLLDILESIGDTYDKCVVCIPAKNFFFRTIELPFKSRKNISQVLSFEVESLLPGNSDDLYIDFSLLAKNSKESSDHNKAIVASIQKSRLDWYETLFQASTIHPDVVSVGTGYSSALIYAGKTKTAGSSFFIYKQSSSAVLYAVKAGEIVLVRKFVLERDDPFLSVKKNIVQTFLAYNELIQTDDSLHEIIISGNTADTSEFYAGLEKEIEVPVRSYNVLQQLKIKTVSDSFDDHDLNNVQNAVAMSSIDVIGIDSFNFSKKISNFDLFLSENKSGIIIASVLLVMLFLSLAIDPVIKINAMEKKIATLDTKIVNTFKSSFPEVTTIVDPIHQMRSKMNALKKREKTDFLNKRILAVDLLQEISKSLPSNLDIDFSRLVMTQTSLMISGSTDRFNTIDDMKNYLEGIQSFKSVDINSASMDKSSNRVKFNFNILLQEKGV